MGTFAAACAATMSGDLLRSVAEERFVRRAGLSRCDARLPQALLLPPPSRQHNGLEGMQDSQRRKQYARRGKPLRNENNMDTIGQHCLGAAPTRAAGVGRLARMDELFAVVRVVLPHIYEA